MKEIIDGFVNMVVSTLIEIGPFGGIILIMLESIFPVLPLSVFITLNMVSYGSLLGFIISWVSTIIGCSISFFLFRYLFSEKLYKFIKSKDNEKLENTMKRISHIELSNLVILMAMPFTPAFLVNIASGLSKISYKKFFISLFIGKAVMIYFWGYIGTTLLESITDIDVIIKLVLMIVVTYFISKFVQKKLKVN